MKELKQTSPNFEKLTRSEMENLRGGKSIIKIPTPIGSPGPTYPEGPYASF